jgi:hypothetical protein
MGTKKLTDRVDFTYIVGIILCGVLLILAIIFYNDSIYPLLLPTGGLFSYLGVVIRGIYDPNTWGISNHRRKISVLVGYISLYVITYVEIFLLLFIGLNIQGSNLMNCMIIAGVFLILLFYLLLRLYIKKLSVMA